MHVFRSVCVVVLLGIFFAVPAGRAEEATEATPVDVEWMEEGKQATIFAQDWIADLDAGDFVKAAGQVLPLGKKPDPSNPKTLRDMRAELGEFSSRALTQMHAEVYAAASDDSECKVRVRYSTKAERKNVLEVVEVLLVKGREPVVLDYRFEPYQKSDIGITME
jgi:hypothetical protein